MKARDIQRENTLQTILAVGLELFAKQGFDRTSIRMIAEKAGLSLGLLYNYFPSKESVLGAILEKEGKENAPAQSLLEGVTPFQQLEHYVKTSLQAMEENPDYWRLLHSMKLLPDLLATVAPGIQEERKKEIARLTKLMAAAGSHSPSAEAALLMASVDGMIHQYLTNETFPLQDAAIRYVLQLKNHLGT